MELTEEREPRELVFRNTLVFRCDCGYERYLTNDPEILRMRLDIPGYGKVSVAELAKLDEANHSCEQYFRAVRRAEASRTLYKRG